ncbi:MAG: hypothetical protein M3Z35_14350 [Nitrospirota bacterium]|nr:hypothetical protein [Nitrospirota bacterium]
MQNSKCSFAGFFTFYFCMFTFALALSACAVPTIPSRIIYENPTDFVRLEPDPYAFHEITQTLHSHPADIDVEEMVQLLKGFSVQDHRNAVQRWFAGESSLEPVFREDEIAWLAPRLSQALAVASPDERATFYISYPQTSIKREITSGGLYVQNGRLHFILGNYRIVYGIPAYGMVYDRRYPVAPTAAKGFNLFFNPANAVEKQKATWWEFLSGQKKDEVVIDLQKLPAMKTAHTPA